ncbi:hypothetical protein [Aromatoleum toluvorans]|nr:hypothetical protein [Aromatoleum toluvorans]
MDEVEQCRIAIDLALDAQFWLAVALASATGVGGWFAGGYL